MIIIQKPLSNLLSGFYIFRSPQLGSNSKVEKLEKDGAKAMMFQSPQWVDNFKDHMDRFYFNSDGFQSPQWGRNSKENYCFWCYSLPRVSVPAMGS